MNKVELNRLSQVNNNEQNFLAALNENLKRIQEAINDTLSRSGVAPNQMEEVLDMNGNRICNVGPAVELTDVVTKQDIQNIIDAANEAIEQLDGLVEAGKTALMNYAQEYIYPTVTAALDGAQAAQRAAESARDALLLNPDYQALTQNLPEIMQLVNALDGLQGILDNMTKLLAVSDDLTNIDAVAADLTNLDAIAGNLQEILRSSTYAQQAAQSASQASTSASNAAYSASDADSYATQAHQYAQAASNSATTASGHADTALSQAQVATLEAEQAQESAGDAVNAATSAGTSASMSRIWAEGSDSEVVPLGGTHSAKVWAQYVEEIITGTRVFGGSFDASTATATLTSAAKTKLGTDANTIVLTNDTTPITGYAANEAIEYVVTTDGTFAGLTLSAQDILWSTGTQWLKMGSSGGGATYTAGYGISIDDNNEISSARNIFTGSDLEIVNDYLACVTEESPTISADGIASGFSDTNRLYISNLIRSASESFEIVTAVSIPSTAITTSYMGLLDSTQQNNSGIGLRLDVTQDYKLSLRVSTDGSTTYPVNIVGTTDLPIGTKVWIKVRYSSSTGYALYLSSDGATWMLEGASPIIGLPYPNTGFYIGDNVVTGAAFTGSIYLAETTFKVDDVLVCKVFDKANSRIEGKNLLRNTATGTDSLTILGTPTTEMQGINIGPSSLVLRTRGIAIGYSAWAGFGVAIGYNSRAGYNSSPYCVAVGNGAQSDYGSIAIGGGAYANNISSVAIGANANAGAYGSITLGMGCRSNTSGTFTVSVGGTPQSRQSVILLDAAGKVPTDRYIPFTGATGTDAGSTGSVPVPAAGDNTKFLRGDGTWGSASYDSNTGIVTL